jgi:hypothetical protein
VGSDAATKPQSSTPLTPSTTEHPGAVARSDFPNHVARFVQDAIALSHPSTASSIVICRRGAVLDSGQRGWRVTLRRRRRSAMSSWRDALRRVRADGYAHPWRPCMPSSRLVPPGRDPREADDPLPATTERGPPLLTPIQHMNLAGERPFLPPRDQSLSHRVQTHVLPFLLITLS